GPGPPCICACGRARRPEGIVDLTTTTISEFGFRNSALGTRCVHLVPQSEFRNPNSEIPVVGWLVPLLCWASSFSYSVRFVFEFGLQELSRVESSNGLIEARFRSDRKARFVVGGTARHGTG